MDFNIQDYRKIKHFRSNKNNNVILIQHKKTHKKRVLKIVRIVNKEKQIQELEIHKKLSNKFVIELHQSRVTNNYIFMLFEYMRGGDVKQNINKFAEMPSVQTLAVFHNILLCIRYLHQ